MPGVAMSSKGDRISCPLSPPAVTAPAFDRGFMSFVKERRFPASLEETSEMSLMGESLSAAKFDDGAAEVEPGVEGEAREAVFEEDTVAAAAGTGAASF